MAPRPDASAAVFATSQLYVPSETASIPRTTHTLTSQTQFALKTLLDDFLARSRNNDVETFIYTNLRTLWRQDLPAVVVTEPAPVRLSRESVQLVMNFCHSYLLEKKLEPTLCVVETTAGGPGIPTHLHVLISTRPITLTEENWPRNADDIILINLDYASAFP